MTLPIVITIFSVAIFLFAVYVRQNTQRLKKELSHLEKIQRDLEEKLNSAREGASKAKLELQKKETSLNDLREQTKAKLRKFAQKADGTMDEASAAGSLDDNIAGLEKTITTLRLQLEQTQKEVAIVVQAAVAEHDQSRKNEVSALSNALAQAKSENQKLRTKLDGIKNSSHLAELGINIDDMPIELVKEIARLHNKAQQNQNMRTVIQSKFNLVNEKYTEIQRKYFDVCRQLAMTMGKEASDVASLPTETGEPPSAS